MAMKQRDKVRMNGRLRNAELEGNLFLMTLGIYIEGTGLRSDQAVQGRAERTGVGRTISNRVNTCPQKMRKNFEKVFSAERMGMNGRVAEGN